MADGIVTDYPADGVCRITLDRPDSGNAFTHAMYAMLLGEFRRLREDLDVRVVILTGAGRHFCTGHDLRDAGPDPDRSTDLGELYAAKRFLSRLSAIPVEMRGLPQPVICAVNGAAAGIGLALALASDIILAGERAKFVNAIHNAGTGHELGISYMLPRQIGTQRAAELLLTARPVLADEAERIGLALRAVADDALMAEALAMAEQIRVNVPMGIWMTKQSLWLNQETTSLRAAIELEHRAVHIAQSTQDAAEKRASFLEKRSPHFSLK